MAFYPNVSPKEKFRPNAQLSNDVRNAINKLGGISETNPSATVAQNTEISVYNPGTAQLYANSAVEIDVNCQVYNNTYPVKMSLNGSGAFGILTQTLASGQCGSMITSGVVQVPAYGSKISQYVRVENGMFWYDDRPYIPVMYGTAELASINLGGGGSAGGGVAVYDGPFTVQLTTNILNPSIRQLRVCNPSAVLDKTIAGEVESSSGDGVTVPETNFPLVAGYVYLKLQAVGKTITAEFVQSSTQLSSRYNTEYVQLAQVGCDEYGSPQLCQIWRGGNVRINYRWW